jgi:hypothetical protein
MQIQDIVKIYQAKSDEELMQLGDAREQLTSEALLALKSELSRRQISIAEHSEPSPNNVNLGGSVVARKKVQEGERQGVGDFVAEVFRTYHIHFWLFFKICAPAVIISTIAIIIGRNEAREIARHLPGGPELLSYRSEILEIWLASFSAWLVSWLAFLWAFGATCIAVEEVAAGFTPSAWHSLLNVRERLGPLLRLGLLLFVLVLVVEAASMLLGTGVFWVLRQWKVHPTGFLLMVVSYGVVSLGFLVLSRFALAVPAVLLDDCRVGQAMLRSDELTEGKWLTLAALLAKTIVGGYVAAMWPFWLVSSIRISAPLPFWFSWMLTAASVVGVTIVEPTMFIRFTLLYLKMSALGSAPSKTLTSQLA